MMLLKEEKMYMLEETDNVGLGVRSLSADAGPGSHLLPFGRGGPIWETVSNFFYIYAYNVLLKIHGDWPQDAGDGQKVFLGLTIIRFG